MRVVIVGGSKFGVATAEQLIDSGHEVVLIDRNRQRLDALSERLDCGMIEGDGTLPSVLRDAHRDDEDVLVALTNASEDNIMASLVARSVGYGRVIPQIVAAELFEVCRELDLKDVIAPHQTVADSIRHALEDKSEVEDRLTLSNELRLRRLTIGEDAPDTIGALDLGDDIRAVARIRGDSETLAISETGLRKGDVLLCAGSVKALEGAEGRLCRTD